MPAVSKDDPKTVHTQFRNCRVTAAGTYLIPFLKEGGLAAKLTALGFFYANGKASDLPVVQPLENEKTAVPKNEDPEAKWQCEVPKADGKENETKDIKDVGEFVRFCVMPAMKAR